MPCYILQKWGHSNEKNDHKRSPYLTYENMKHMIHTYTHWYNKNKNKNGDLSGLPLRSWPLFLLH